MDKQPVRSYALIAAAIIVGALVISASILASPRFGRVTTLTSTSTSTSILTNTIILASSVVTQTTTLYSNNPPQLFGSSGAMSIVGLTNSTSYEDFFYFRANSSNQQYFDFRSANFSTYVPSGPTTTFSGGQTCLYYKITFQDGSSENLVPCGTQFAPRTYFIFTQHVHPRAGIAYSTNGEYYFLVSEG